MIRHLQLPVKEEDAEVAEDKEDEEVPPSTTQTKGKGKSKTIVEPEVKVQEEVILNDPPVSAPVTWSDSY